MHSNSGLFQIAILLTSLTGCAAQERTVVFDPATAPNVDAGEYHVKGDLDLRVELKNANPICASYALSLNTEKYSPQPAIAAIAPGVPQGGSGLTPPPENLCEDKKGTELASCAAVGAAAAAKYLQGVQKELQGWQHDLDDVWLQCDAPTALKAGQPNAKKDDDKKGTFEKQALEIQNLAGKVRDVGLDDAVSAAASAALTAFGAARALRAEQAELAGKIVVAKNAVQRAKDALDAAVAAKKKQADVDPLKAAHKGEQEKLDALQASADQLEKQITTLSEWSAELNKMHSATRETTAKLRSDVVAALALIPPSIGGTAAQSLLAKRHFEPSQLVTIEVTETRRAGGKLIEKGADRSLGKVQLAVVRPILVDVGVGPAVTFESERAYGIGANQTIAVTSETPNLDGIVTLSAYWQPRYLDNKFFAPLQLVPRPMIGLSMRQPFTSLYFGAQLDPIQFLDISFGGRFYTTTELVGKAVGDPADQDAEGKPVAPLTQSKTNLAFFMSISASTDLFASWIKALAK